MLTLFFGNPSSRKQTFICLSVTEEPGLVVTLGLLAKVQP